MLHIIWHIIVGFVVGLLARAVMPGAQSMGIIKTTLLGIVGGVVGGLIGRLFSKPEPGSAFHPAGFIMSVIGAVVVLFLWTRFAPAGYSWKKRHAILERMKKCASWCALSKRRRFCLRRSITAPISRWRYLILTMPPLMMRRCGCGKRSKNLRTITG
jgi:uncharacterized membrane protein YeaQ/YmgE (transglycosylase-associated protein family)